jgi:hypothetical protein
MYDLWWLAIGFVKIHENGARLDNKLIALWLFILL